MKTNFFLLISFLSLILSSKTELTKSEMEKILKGEQIIKEVSNPDSLKKGKTYQITSLVKGTLEEVYAVLSNYEKYPEFMPNIDEVKITSRNGVDVVGEYRLGLPFGKVKRYRLLLKSRKKESGFVLSWKKIPWPELSESETIVDTRGRWVVELFKSKDKSKEGFVMVDYLVYTDPGKIPFGLGWIVDILTSKSVPKILIAVSKRVKTIYYKGRK